MKKIVSLSTLLVCCLCLAACNSSKTKKEVSSETTTVQESTTTQDTTTIAESTIKDTQVIGSDTYGYVKVPKSWIHFTEVEGGDDIQYCDGTDINIVTLILLNQSTSVLVKVNMLLLMLFKSLLVFIKRNNKARISLKFGVLSQKLVVMTPMS